MSTFLQMQQQVALQFDSQATLNVKAWINSGAHQFYDRRKFAWRETTGIFASVAGQQDYVLAGAAPLIPDFDGLISVMHNDSAGGSRFTRLREMFQDDFDDLFGFCGNAASVYPPIAMTLRGTAGTPTSSSAAVRSGGEQVMAIFPVHNFVGSFRFRYVRAAGSIEMVNDSDVPLAPVQYHRAIIDLAIAIGLRDEDQMIQSNIFTQAAETQIQAAIAADVALRAAERSKTPAPPRQPPTDPRQGPPYGYEESRD